VAFEIASVSAIEMLDSLSRPTLQVTVMLTDGTRADAGVPTGVSRGSQEAAPLHDGTPERFNGLGVLDACGKVEGEIARLLLGRTWTSLEEVDQALCDLDGTATLGRLGANAIAGMSMAVARALAAAAGQQLYGWLPSAGAPARLPAPAFTMFSGGAHAESPLDFQEFMVVPVGAGCMSDAVRAGTEIYAALKRRLGDWIKPAGLSGQGGFASPFGPPEMALRFVTDAIADAGYPTGPAGVCIAIDAAATHFQQADGTYRINGETLTAADLVTRYVEMVDAYPVWSIEDGMAEGDRDGWRALTETLGDRIQLVGDDVFCTNPALIKAGMADGIGNAALISLTQIGTVTRTLDAIRTCQNHGWTQMVGGRVGETTDSFIADLAVASGCGQIKSGAPVRREAIAKYNRLVDIAGLAPQLPYGLTDAARRG